MIVAGSSNASPWVVTIVGGVIAAAVAGVLVLVIQYKVFEDAATAPQNDPDQVVVDEPPSSTPTASVDPGAAPSEPVSEPEPVQPPPVDSVTITEARVEFASSNGNIAPGVVRSDYDPGYYVAVFSAAGEVPRSGCYVHFETYNNGVLLDTDDGRCWLQGGWSSEYWPRLDYDAGSVRVVATILTDAGGSATAVLDYEMRDSG